MKHALLQRATVVAGAACLLCTTAADAGVLTPIQSNIADYEPYVTASTGATAFSNGTGGDVRVGARTTTTNSAGVFGFALPDLAGETIVSATITFNARNETNRAPQPGANLDLYGLGVDPGTDTGAGLNLTQDPNRQYIGPNDVSATKLQDDILHAADVPTYDGLATVRVAFTSVDISSYLNSLYTGGANPGDFVVIRLSQDVLPTVQGTTNNRFRIVSTSGDGSTLDSSPHTIDDGAPFLQITTAVPEPASLGLTALAGVALLRRRRR
jgi:hypothetical protein